jgi:hypothetical protein
VQTVFPTGWVSWNVCATINFLRLAVIHAFQCVDMVPSHTYVFPCAAYDSLITITHQIPWIARPMAQWHHSPKVLIPWMASNCHGNPTFKRL